MAGDTLIDGWSPLQTPTVLDYGEVLLALCPLDRRSAHLLGYICELSLLYTSLTLPSPARLASAALLLARALHHHSKHRPSRRGVREPSEGRLGLLSCSRTRLR